VHPESYPIVDRMARDLGCRVGDLLADASVRARIAPEKYVTETVGLPTLTDILAELAKPGRDPRQAFEAFSFQDGIEKIEDLRPGMKLPGIVTNVTAFGAFVDIGVHQDGLVHVSQLSDRFVKDPAEVVKVQQEVTVTVLEVDLPRRRIALSLKTGAKPADVARGFGPAKGVARVFPGRRSPEGEGGSPARVREHVGRGMTEAGARTLPRHMRGRITLSPGWLACRRRAWPDWPPRRPSARRSAGRPRQGR